MGTGKSAVRAVCAATALFFFAGHAVAETLVVASYNLRNYLAMDRMVDGRLTAAAPKPAQEIEAVVGVLRSIRPDVVGLVEMGDEDMLDDLQSRLAKAGIDLPHGELVKGADPDRHLALLSRFPIVDRNSRDDIPFTLRDTRQRMARGILDITIRTEAGHTLRLVGTHLKSQRAVPDFDEREFRTKEAFLLRSHLDAILAANPQENVLLFGDLNDTKNEYPIKLLEGSPGSPLRLRNLPLADRHGQRWTHYWPAADTYSRLDYFFVSSHLWPLVRRSGSGINNNPLWNRASDHRAIFTTISFPKK